MSLKILDSRWYSSFSLHKLIGIVVAEDHITGKRKVYMGPGLGINQKRDEEYILKRGAPVDPKRLLEWLQKYDK